jgi:hypothetical protein
VKQSRLISLLEAITNVALGYGIAVVTQVAVFPLFGLYLSLSDNLLISGVFTVVSVARSYAIRRLFEALRHRLSNDRNASNNAIS